jgi:hypothetical protein
MLNMNRTPAGLAAAAALVATTVVGCGGDHGSTAASTSSSAASSSTAATSSGAAPGTSAAGAQQDYSGLLIKPGDVGPEAFVDGPPTQNPGGTTGVGQVFKNPDGKRTIVDTIGVYPDAASAVPVAAAMKDEVAKKVSGAQQPVDIGANGFMVAGTAADPAKQMEISEVVFTEGRALVDLEVDCSVGNPTPTDVLLDLARKQDAAIKAGLPG